MSHEKSQYTIMTQTPVNRLIVSLAGPTIVSMMITAFYNAADTYYVSLLNITSATGAIGVVFPLMSFVQAISFAISMGSGSWISRLLGQKKPDEANEVASSALTIALLFGTVIAVSTFAGSISNVLRAIGATESILPFAEKYAQCVILGAPMLMGSMVLNKMLCAEGKARFSMIGIASGGILNILLDPFFILDRGLGLGTTGAAVATAISETFSFIILLIPYLRSRTEITLSTHSISHSFHRYIRILLNGMPSFFRQALSSVSAILLNVFAAKYALSQADSAIAAMSVVSKVFMLNFSLIIGFGQGYQPVIGYNYGARIFSRARQAFFFTLTASTVMMSLLGVIGFLAAPQIIALFSSEAADANMISFGVYAFRAQCLSMPLTAMGNTSNMTFQSTGHVKLATLLASCRQGIFLIPSLFVLSHFWGLRGVFIAQPVSDVLTFFTCLIVDIPFIRKLKQASSVDLS